ncbi:NAD(P)/FAD-dependent oxidoreductase [Chloroflexota bacterium]
MAKKHLIIGCGSAGLAALEKIRHSNSEDAVKMVTNESYPPYSPTALPYLLMGRITEDNLWIHDENYFSKMECTLLQGKEVVKVLPEKREVLYNDGTGDEYDSLLIASGSEPLAPSIPGLQETGFLVFRTLADFHKLSLELSDKKDIAILGAGLVGMELAACLLEKGHLVQIVEREPNILPRYFDAETSAIIGNTFEAKGAILHLGRNVNEVRRESGRVSLTLSPQATVEADLLIVVVGMKPRTHFLNETGVTINDGIVVDRKMRSSVEGIYAAGDVAESPDFFFGKPGLNPIIPSATSQGKIAGANMAGEDKEYEGWISRIVFNSLGHTAFSAGLVMPSQGDYQTFSANSRGGFTRMIFQGGRLVGVSLIDRDVDPGVLVYLIRNRVDVGQHREFLMEKPGDVSRWLMLQAEKETRGVR